MQEQQQRKQTITPEHQRKKTIFLPHKNTDPPKSPPLPPPVTTSSSSNNGSNNDVNNNDQTQVQPHMRRWDTVANLMKVFQDNVSQGNLSLQGITVQCHNTRCLLACSLLGACLVLAWCLLHLVARL